MKRAPSSGKKSHVAGDFKRLKAKVGKRAPQKLNSTETKFRTATVTVQTQSVSVSATALSSSSNHHHHHHHPSSSSSSTLVSSRGKHLTQLIITLNHPAANARSSALQGMEDAIAPHHTPNHILPQHLSLLIPSLAKCFVDEDSAVRTSARRIFFRNVSRRLRECGRMPSIRPFLRLILAYIGSALHSLDPDIRYDGCVALESLCHSYQSLFRDAAIPQSPQPISHSSSHHIGRLDAVLVKVLYILKQSRHIHRHGHVPDDPSAPEAAAFDDPLALRCLSG